MRIVKLRSVALVLVSILGISITHAQSYPSKPIRFLVPASPGGAPDFSARLVGQHLSDALGQTVIVDTRDGGRGIIGTEIGAKSAPDGHTLILGYAGPFSINPGLYQKLSYDPVRDFDPITLIAAGQNILVVNPSVAAKSVKELIALAKNKPDQLTFASGGTGQSSHLSMELFMWLAKIKMVHVPYKGNTPAMRDVLGGQVMMQFIALTPAIPQIKLGKLRGLGVTGGKRSNAIPEVPTIAEAGVAGYQVLTWYGAFVPAKTPKAITAKLNAEMVRIIGLPDVADRFQRFGLDPVGNSSQEFGKYLRSEISQWREVIKEAKIQVD